MGKEVISNSILWSPSEERIKSSQMYKFMLYINEKYNLKLPESSEYETLGGLILSSISNMPKQNEKIEINNSLFVVSNVSDNFIEEVILVLNNK